MLEASGIYKSYGRRQILKGAGLTANSGECVGIIGSNGCGKTTLLAILAGAQKTNKGTILYDGKEAVGHPAVFASKTAYVPQENPLMEELSVKDNLLLWYRGNRDDMEKDLETGAGAMLGIGHMLHRTAGKLSGGMKKRLSITCALSNHAPVLILDEPGAALDLECKELIREYLSDYMKEGGTVLLTSHELAELSSCTRFMVLKDGLLSELALENPAADLTAEVLIQAF